MPTPSILDIDQLMEDYAWGRFQNFEAETWNVDSCKNLRRADFRFELCLKRLVILHDEPKYESLELVSSKDVEVWNCTFTNNSLRYQDYHFQNHCSTESVCNVRRDQCFRLGGDFKLSFKIPEEIARQNTGFSRQLGLSQIHDVFTATVPCWKVDNKMKVEVEFQATLQLMVQEVHYCASFSVASYLSGTVAVSVFRRNGDFLGSFPVTVNDAFRCSGQDEPISSITRDIAFVEQDYVKLVSKGHCDFQFGNKQHVVIDAESVDPTFMVQDD